MSNPFTPSQAEQEVLNRIAAQRERLRARRALRKAVKMRAHLRDRGTTRFEIDVIDLSITGFRALTSFTLWPGQTVWLTLPGLAGLDWKASHTLGCVAPRSIQSAKSIPAASATCAARASIPAFE